MILMIVLGILMSIAGLWFVYVGDVINGIVFIAVGNLYIDEASDTEELKYIRSELKLLQASQHHR